MTDMAESPKNSSDTSFKEAGRGFILITGAKIWFLLTATLMSLAFPRLFGDTVLFGRYRVVSGILNVFTMIVITATVQGVSRLASTAGTDMRGVRRMTLAVQIAVFGPLFLALFIGSDLIAEVWLSDKSLGVPLRVASLVVLVYMFYAALVGLLNGMRRFGAQAALDVGFSTMKMVFMVAVIVATGSVTLAYGGFAAAAVAILVVSIFVTRGPVDAAPEGFTPRAGEYLKYLLPLAGYALILNMLFQADIIGLKAALARVFTADKASAIAGIYGATKNIALMPYQAVISITFVVFPMVSSAASGGDLETAGKAASGAVRLATVLAFFSVAVLGAAPTQVIGLIFGPDYVELGAPVMVILLAGGALMALMFILNAVLASAGHPVISVLGGGGAMAIQGGTMFIGLRATDITAESACWIAAWATLAGSLAGILVAGILVAHRLKGAPWVWTVVSSTASAVVAVAISRWMSGIWWPASLLVAGIVYLAMMWVVKGIINDDIARIAGIFQKKR